jgi:hypothetical protein
MYRLATIYRLAQAEGQVIGGPTQTLMSYPKDYVEGKLPAYRAPDNFFPGGNAIGIIEAAPITIGASRCASMKAASV